EARRLEAEAIKALMGTGATFTFVGAGGQATGTSTWNLTTGTAYGAFTWEGRLSGTWNQKWFVKDDLSCLQNATGSVSCQQIFGYGDGFFEVDADGTIHTHTIPMQVPKLKAPLKPGQVADLFPAMMAWAQKIDLRVVSAAENDGVITIELSNTKGTKSTFRLDAASGLLLGSN
ncbi:MAG: hypothetical protein GY798_00985, partial [Hyphomicrobiales bacterium]|nr:hypothetical protein [Hyphomicrobiales bacterium]